MSRNELARNVAEDTAYAFAYVRHKRSMQMREAHAANARAESKRVVVRCEQRSNEKALSSPTTELHQLARNLESDCVVIDAHMTTRQIDIATETCNPECARTLD